MPNKRLDWRKGSLSACRQKQRKARVTIIVGIIAKDRIVVGSDGQTSKTTSQTAKRLDADKIAVVQFQDGTTALVAESGSSIITSRLIEIMKQDAKETGCADYRAPADCAERAVRKLKSELLIPLLPEQRTAEELQAVYNSHEAALLIAYYHNKTDPYLYSIDFSVGIACREYKYALLGCGSNVAELLVSWFNFKEMTFAPAVVTVAFIIGEVKKVDAFCGGNTNITSLEFGTGVVRGQPPPDKLRALEAEVEAGSQRYKAEWGDRAFIMIEEIVKRWGA